jgi:hypothetical protein
MRSREMSIEGKDFVIKDRRSFDTEGRLKEEEKEEEKKEAKEEKKDAPKQEDTERPPLPEVNFSSLIFSLSSSALLHLGDIADPQTGETRKDLPMAKHSIDIVAMLKEKTQGNLSDEEKQFIDNILTDLRLRYVKATKK